jgi:hypothetical protein
LCARGQADAAASVEGLILRGTWNRNTLSNCRFA